MRIAVINETSAADKNADILAALQDRGHQVLNLGMTEKGAHPELVYIHTGFMAAVVLNLHCVDLVVGGCGTGQGFLNSAMQYPGVFCGHIVGPLDAWLFTQINGGNCISLPLNQGYGWAGGENLRFIFDRMFSVEKGAGYPANRRQSQKASQELLGTISECAHRDLSAAIGLLPANVVKRSLHYPGMRTLIESPDTPASQLRDVLIDWYGANQEA